MTTLNDLREEWKKVAASHYFEYMTPTQIEMTISWFTSHFQDHLENLAKEIECEHSTSTLGEDYQVGHIRALSTAASLIRSSISDNLK